MNSEYDSHGLNLDPSTNFGFDDDFDESRLDDSMFGADRFEDPYGIDLDNYGVGDDGTTPLKDMYCRYCHQENPECLAQCKICQHWFCNGSTDPSSGSHLVKHLVRSRHKEVALHPSSPLEGIPLECYHCSCKNVFLLGFVPAKNESMVLLLCRSPCAYQHTSRDTGCDFSEWEPIISDKRFISWLIKVPIGPDLVNVRPVTAGEIAQIDDCLRAVTLTNGKPNPEINDENVLRTTRSFYENAQEYSDTFTPLIQLEADYDKLLKEALVQKNVTIRCEMSVGNKRNIYFVLPQTDSEMRLMQGDEVSLCLEDNKKSFLRGNVVKVPNNYGEEIGVELKHGFNLPEFKNGWSVEFVWKPITFDRMKNAFKSFVKNESEMSEHIRNKILGIKTPDEQIKLILPKRFSAPGLPELNHSQVYAIKMALQKPFSLIQGPPGTGKTVTSATLVYHIIKQCGGKVLVCAPSNIAVDQLADKINRTGLKVVRVCARSREAIDSKVASLTLHSQINYIESVPEFSSLRNLKNDQGELTDADAKKYVKLRDVMEKQIISNADVVCTTCIGAGDPRIVGLKFRCVLLDESTQATEPECLVPIVHGVRQLILVGDHCQLGPVVMCKKAANAGLSKSLFERLIEIGVKPFRLQVQYRMHPALSEFSSSAFYEGTLQNGVTTVERSHPGIDFPWPIPEKPMFFYCAYGREEISSSGTSFLNRTECAAVEMFITRLLKSGIKPTQIGIITPYEGQRAYLVSYMLHSGHMSASIYQNIEVASVDAFQGREKDYIIMSCVRSNEHQGIGFLNDPRRLNVAITRSRFGLIIVGNPKMLCKHNLWAQLLNDYKDKNLLVEGPINHLRPSSIILNKPSKHSQKPIDSNKNSGNTDNSANLDESTEKIHDICNVLLPVPTDKLVQKSKTCSIPLQVILPPLAETDFLKTIETDTQDQSVETVDEKKMEPYKDLKNDILSFAKNFASFNLPSLIGNENILEDDSKSSLQQ